MKISEDKNKLKKRLEGDNKQESSKIRKEEEKSQRSDNEEYKA